jgi:hypothetical protein
LQVPIQVAPNVSRALASFSKREASYPDSWKDFFGELDTHIEGENWEVVARAASTVLKIFVWSADAVANRASHYAIVPGQAAPYADVTQFVRNWGIHASQVTDTMSGLQQRGEEIAERVMRAQDKMFCFKCGKSGHLNSMCFVNKRKTDVRPRKAGDQDDDEGYQYGTKSRGGSESQDFRFRRKGSSRERENRSASRKR